MKLQFIKKKESKSDLRVAVSKLTKLFKRKERSFMESRPQEKSFVQVFLRC